MLIWLRLCVGCYSSQEFQRNGDVHLATTMCWLLSEPIMKRCLFICNFHFDMVILILLLLSLGYAEGKGGA
jgi:hypothetical protein